MSRSLAIIMKKFNLTVRLSALASCVADGARLIDVGTDHAYVPVSLLLDGRAEHAWASDINSGPLRSARENALLYGVADRLTLYLSDGLRDCECDVNRYDHVVIAGMGGEMIASIISAQKYLTLARPKLILQPMTMQSYLRRFLCENGYRIHEERIVFDEGKYYTVIVAFYTGECCNMTELELAFGKRNLEAAQSDSVTHTYLENQCGILKKIVDGKKLGGADCFAEESVLAELSRILGGI